MDNVFSQAEILTAFKLQCLTINEHIIDAVSEIAGVLSVAYDVLDNANIFTIYADKRDISYGQMQAYIAAIEVLHNVSIELVECVNVADLDWVLHAQQLTPILQVGNVTVAGTHYADEELPKVGRIIRLDAGAAFGTGEHGTTYGCAKAIIATLKTQKPKTILDMGCGTALLAMIAAKLAPDANVLAVDNDKVAVKVAKENIRLNKLHNNIEALVGNGFNCQSIYGKQFDLIIANILARPVCKMSGAMNAHLSDNGTLILSGFYQRDIAKVFAYFRVRQFHIHRIIRIDEWAILILRKNKMQ